MTTSGVIQGKIPISQLIQEAFDICQVGVEEESVDAEDYQRALRSANFMLRSWQAQGFHLWQYQELVLFLDIGRGEYPFNSDTVNVYRRDLFISAPTVTDAAEGTNDLVVKMENLVDCDGIEYDTTTDNNLIGWNCWAPNGNTMFKSIIITAITNDPGEIDIALDTNLPMDYNSGSVFYIFPPSWLVPKLVPTVERILDVRRIQGFLTTGEVETPIKFDSHQEFHRLPNRNTQGAPNVATFDRLKNNGCLKIWQTAADETTYQMALTAERTFEGFENTDDTADFPQYWQDAFVYNLAKRLSIKFRVPPQVYALINEQALETLNQALEYDNANYDLNVVINNRVGGS